MKKTLFLLFSALFPFCAFSEIISISAIPSSIFTGDTAVLRAVFESSQPFLPKNTESLELTTDFRAFEKMSELCLVRSARISKMQSGYELTLKIVAWKSGDLDFPPFDAGELVQKTLGGEVSIPSQIVDFSPISVESIAQKMNEQTMRSFQPPLLLPGSSFLIAFFAFAILIFLVVLSFFLSKIGAISFFLERYFSRVHFLRFAKKFRKNLKKLSKAEFSDAEFAEKIQNLLREFLQNLLDLNFFALASGEVESAISQKHESVFPLEFEKAKSIFFKTDLIRFSKNPSAAFQNRSELIAELCDFAFSAAKFESDFVEKNRRKK